MPKAQRIFEGLKSLFLPSENSFETSEEDASRDALYRPASLAFLVGLIVGILTMGLLLPVVRNQPLWLQMLISFIPFHLCAFASTLLALVPLFLKIGFRKTLDIPCPVRRNHLRLTVKMLILLFLSVMVVNGMVALIWRALGLAWEPQSIVRLIHGGKGCAIWFVTIIGSVFLAPISEEIMLRLVVFRTLRSFFTRQVLTDDSRSSALYSLPPVILTSLLFAFFHFSLQYLPALFCVGFLLQIARRHGGLAASILLHSLYNLISVLFLLLSTLD